MSMSMDMQVVVAGTGSLLARCAVANTMRRRLVGLLDHDSLEEGRGLLIEPCNNVHTFFMRFPIDAVFLAADGTIVGMSELVPWRISPIRLRARKVLELPMGSCRRAGLAVGDRLEFSPCSR